MSYQDRAEMCAGIVSVVVAGVLTALACSAVQGCMTLGRVLDASPWDLTNDVPGDVEQPAPAPTTTTTVPPVVQTGDAIDLSTVVWHGPDIRGWPITAPLNAYVRGGELMMETELLKGVQSNNDKGTTGNPWVIIKCRDGKWHASTFEWTSYSRQSRTLWKAFDPGHLNVSAFKAADQSPGTIFYAAVAGFSRGTSRNKSIRTEFDAVVIP